MDGTINETKTETIETPYTDDKGSWCLTHNMPLEDLWSDGFYFCEGCIQEMYGDPYYESEAEHA